MWALACTFCALGLKSIFPQISHGVGVKVCSWRSFMCFFNTLSTLNRFSQYLHWKLNSFACTLTLWSFKPLLDVYTLSHWSQVKIVFSDLWAFLKCWRCLDWSANNLGHWSQGMFFLECALKMWFFKLFLVWNVFWQCSHDKWLVCAIACILWKCCARTCLLWNILEHSVHLALSGKWVFLWWNRLAWSRYDFGQSVHL